VSILKPARAGHEADRMPLFAWYILVTALMMLVGFPPLILGSVLLEIERAFGWPFFDPARRRPAAVAAPVLAVRPPRGLHHLPARRRARCRRSSR
jgi:heme/copper-type cytochrome/quinol oxidase subunit 1